MRGIHFNVRAAIADQGAAAREARLGWNRIRDRCVQVALRRTNQTITAMSSTDSASSHPPSIH